MDHSIIERWLQDQDDSLLYDPDGARRCRAPDLAAVTQASLGHATTALEALLHTFGAASQSAKWFAQAVRHAGDKTTDVAEEDDV